MNKKLIKKLIDAVETWSTTSIFYSINYFINRTSDGTTEKFIRIFNEYEIRDYETKYKYLFLVFNILVCSCILEKITCDRLCNNINISTYDREESDKNVFFKKISEKFYSSVVKNKINFYLKIINNKTNE